LYELCVGLPPFRADSMKALYSKVVKGKFASIPSAYSSELNSLINSMLRVNPKKRPSATELIDL